MTPNQTVTITPKSADGSRKYRVVLSGWYGQGNLGDELILQSIVFQLRTRIPSVSISVLSERPDRLKRELQVRGLRKTRRRSDTAKRILETSRANVFILGGGGILMDYGNRDTNISNWLDDVKTAQALGVPTLVWGVGVGRIWTERSKNWMKEILPKTDHVSVRDNGSALTLSNLGINRNTSCTADPVLMHPDLIEFENEHDELPSSKERPNILVCLRHWYVMGNWTVNDEVFGTMKSSLARLLSHLARTRGASVTFVPLMREGRIRDDDLEVEEEVRSMMESDLEIHVIDHAPDSREFMRLVSDSDLLIGMRLHSLILASAIGVPCIGISYDDKVRNYMSSVGANDWTISMEEVTFENLKRLSDDALNGRYPTANIKKMIKTRRKNAEVDIEKAIVLIETRKPWHLVAKRYQKAAALVLRRMVSRKDSRPISAGSTSLFKERTKVEEKGETSLQMSVIAF